MSYLKEYRQSKKLKRAELAEILGCCESMVAHCENGNRRISPDTALRWSQRAKGLDIKKLLPEFYEKNPQ